MLSYVVITPARDEVQNLPRLADALAAQTVRPTAWNIVDNGSTDGTLQLAYGLAEAYDWVHVVAIAGATAADRGAPIVRALHAGIEEFDVDYDVLVNVDADISMEPDYFEQLLGRFEADRELGIASGSATELRNGEWEQRFVTGSTVWGASRAYRRACLEQLLPFEQRVGWDGLDEFKANANGWRTRAFEDLLFKHHRPEGERDGAAWRARRNQGNAAYFFGYRAWYLVLRSLWNARREPAALAMIWGYTAAAVRREERSTDESGRAYLRRQQSLLRLPLRAIEAAGARSARTR